MRELQMKFIMSTVTARQIKILNTIEKDRMFTINKLADELDISRRTIIKDINDMKIYFQNSASFISKNTGYIFREEDRMLYLENKAAMLNDEIWFEIIADIFYGNLYSLNELADKYNYSESTMQRFAAEISLAVAEYDLELKLNPVDLEGSEGNIRTFFFDFFYECEDTPYTVYPPTDLHKLVFSKFSKEIGDFEIGTSVMTTAFYYYLYIAMTRSSIGCSIDIPPIIYSMDFLSSKDFILFYSFQPIIKEKYDVFLPIDEFIWVAFILVCKRSVYSIEKEKLFYKRFNKWPQISILTKNYFISHGFDNWNKSDMSILLSSFLLAKKINDSICPILNKLMDEEISRIKQLQPLIYEANYEYLLQNSSILNFSKAYFEDIVASLTMYYDIVMSYYTPVKEIAFILEGDHLLIQSIRIHIKNILGDKYHAIFIPLQELTEERLNVDKIDLIVTNYKPYLLDFVIKKEYLLIDRIPTDSDWKRILSTLNPLIN